MAGTLLWKLPLQRLLCTWPLTAAEHQSGRLPQPTGPPWTPQDEEINLSTRGRHSSSFQSPSLLLKLLMPGPPIEDLGMEPQGRGGEGLSCLMLASVAKHRGPPELASIILLPAEAPRLRTPGEGSGRGAAGLLGGFLLSVPTFFSPALPSSLVLFLPVLLGSESPQP